MEACEKYRRARLNLKPNQITERRRGALREWSSGDPSRLPDRYSRKRCGRTEPNEEFRAARACHCYRKRIQAADASSVAPRKSRRGIGRIHAEIFAAFICGLVGVLAHEFQLLLGVERMMTFFVELILQSEAGVIGFHGADRFLDGVDP